MTTTEPAPMPETTEFDWAEWRCLMPTVRVSGFDADAGEVLTAVAPCDSALFATLTSSSSLVASGTYDLPTDWRIECQNGHILALPDDEGNEYSLPLELGTVMAALRQSELAEVRRPT